MKTSKTKVRHSGLDKLRLALGAAMPDKARKGALMPRHLAPLAGVNYETVRQLLNGARRFESETPLNQLMAENLSFATGVHPSFRTSKEKVIRDLWQKPYTAESYRDWIKIGLTPEHIHTTAHSSKSNKTINKASSSFSSEMEDQSKKLLATLQRVAKEKGPQFECMVFRLMKVAMVRVSRDLGVLEEVHNADNNLHDFRLTLGVVEQGDGKLLPTFLSDSSWRPEAPGIAITAGEFTERRYSDLVALLKA